VISPKRRALMLAVPSVKITGFTKTPLDTLVLKRLWQTYSSSGQVSCIPIVLHVFLRPHTVRYSRCPPTSFPTIAVS
jgi:hypothetical protein